MVGSALENQGSRADQKRMHVKVCNNATRPSIQMHKHAMQHVFTERTGGAMEGMGPGMEITGGGGGGICFTWCTISSSNAPALDQTRFARTAASQQICMGGGTFTGEA